MQTYTKMHTHTYYYAYIQMHIYAYMQHVEHKTVWLCVLLHINAYHSTMHTYGICLHTKCKCFILFTYFIIIADSLQLWAGTASCIVQQMGLCRYGAYWSTHIVI